MNQRLLALEVRFSRYNKIRKWAIIQAPLNLLQLYHAAVDGASLTLIHVPSAVRVRTHQAAVVRVRHVEEAFIAVLVRDLARQLRLDI